MIQNQRKLQKEQTKKKILEVAISQFSEHGLQATRTLDIAKEANLSHGTIFSHFATKEDLLESVIELVGMRITARLDELISGKGNLKQVLEAHLQGISEYEQIYTNMILEGPFLNENCRNSIIMIQSAISFHISQVAEKEIANKTIRNMDLDLLYNTWVGLIHHYLINHDLYCKSGSVLKAQGPRLIQHFISLIQLN